MRQVNCGTKLPFEGGSGCLIMNGVTIHRPKYPPTPDRRSGVPAVSPHECSAAPGRFTRRWAVALLVVAVVAAYANTFTAPFVNDDLPAILDNPTLRAPTNLIALLHPPPDTTVAGRPVLNVSFALNYAISGTAVWSYHLLNLLIHLATALLLFDLVLRTLPGRSPARESSDLPVLPPNTSGVRRWRLNGRRSVFGGGGAAAAALLWALHPLQTEAVSYAVQRAESLMSLCFVLTLYAFARHVTTGRVGWAVVSLLGCAAGMATKENMAAVPLVVLLYDRTFVSGTFSEAWRRHRFVHLALAATWAILAACLLSTGGNRGGSVGIGSGASFAAYWLTQVPALSRYVALAVWPNPLVFDYGTFWVTDIRELLLPAFLLGAVAVLVVWTIARSRVALFLAGAAVALLAPTTLMPGTTQMIVEHRVYLALAAAVVPVVMTVHALIGRRAFAVLGCAALALATLTAARNATYRTDLALWSDTVAKRPDNAQARFHLATALLARGRTEGAIAQLRRAVALQPGYAEAQANLGTALLQVGRPGEAVAPLERAVALSPTLKHAVGNLADALRQSGRTGDALVRYEQALQRDSGNATLRANYGNALASTGRLEAARVEFERVLRAGPGSSATRFNYAAVLDGLGRTDDAIAQLREILRVDPAFAPARAALAQLHASPAR